MKIFHSFLSLSLFIRSGIVIFILMVLLLCFRRPVLSLLSLIPFFLRKFFRALYWLVELIVAALHKLLGGIMYNIENALSVFGKRTDTLLDRGRKWLYSSKAKKTYSTLTVLISLGCYLLIVFPLIINTEENSQLTKGHDMYIKAEKTAIGFLASHSRHNAASPDTNNESQSLDPADILNDSLPLESSEGSASPEVIEPEDANQSVQISMVVHRVSSFLRVRDIPSTQDCITLDTLKNGAGVTWSGELQFGFAEGQQEPWIKVITESGVEGWCRLLYLRPEDDIDLALKLIMGAPNH